jgi:hypothetical protein
VGKKGVERVERAQREVVCYLRQLAAGASLQLPTWIVPRFPMTTLTVRAAAAGRELRSR